MGMQFALLVEIALTDLLKYEGGGGLLQLLQLCVMKIGYEKLPRNEWVTISQTRLVAWS